jgi:hypothetical protein
MAKRPGCCSLGVVGLAQHGAQSGVLERRGSVHGSARGHVGANAARAMAWPTSAPRGADGDGVFVERTDGVQRCHT